MNNKDKDRFLHRSGAWLRRVLLALAWALPALAAPAQDAAVELGADGETPLAGRLEFFEDPSRRLHLAAVMAQGEAGRFQPLPAEADANFGYSASAFWLRFRVALQPGAAPDRLLEIAFPSLDDIRVFAPAPGGGYALQQAGDLRPFSERPYAHRNFVFPLHLSPGAPQTIYLRVASEGSLTVPATLWTAPSLHRADQGSYALLAVYFGMLLALMVYNLLLYLSLHDRLFLAYVAFVACMAVGQASFEGLGNQFLWPGWPAWGNVALPVGMAMTGLSGAVFTRTFLTTRLIAPALDRTLLALAAAFAFAALSPAILPYRYAAIATSLTGIVFAVAATLAGIVCLRRGHLGARYFLLAWTLLLAGVAVLALRNLAVLPTNWLTTYSMQIGSALEMLLLSFALGDRINAMRGEKELAQSAALQAKQELVDGLRRNEVDLAARVDERTRALADANARLMAHEQQLKDMAHHDALTGLANRILLDDRIDHGLAQARRGGRLLAVLVADLDGFKTINDRFGHATGDHVLIELAGRLRLAVREVDTVARIGGDEFVVVLTELHNPSDAAEVAGKLLGEMARPIAANGRSHVVTASIGIAVFPAHGSDATALLRHADAAMYLAKQGGRNCYRMASSETHVAAQANGRMARDG